MTPVVRIIALGVTALGWPLGARAQVAACPGDTQAQRITEALGRIERSIDPCGESAQIAEVFAQLKRCTAGTYRICTSLAIDRNVFDRPIGEQGQALPRTITWNPELRSTLEPGCDGDPTKPVPRDPTASLLHELVHAVQDCAGLNPGEYELEAVRIENIYRRATGLCQRSSYGDEPLPATMMRTCTAGNCPCSVPREPLGIHQAQTHPARLPIHTAATNSTASQVGDGTHSH